MPSMKNKSGYCYSTLNVSTEKILKCTNTKAISPITKFLLPFTMHVMERCCLFSTNKVINLFKKVLNDVHNTAIQHSSMVNTNFQFYSWQQKHVHPVV